MSYTVRHKDGRSFMVLADQEVNGDYSVTFTGRRVNSYGEIQQDNYLWLMENFASDVAPINPVVGQLWFDARSKILRVCTAKNTWHSLLTATTVQDSSPEIGSLYFDYRTQRLMVYTNVTDGWMPVGPSLPNNQIFLNLDDVVITQLQGGQQHYATTSGKYIFEDGLYYVKVTATAASKEDPLTFWKWWIREGMFVVDNGIFLFNGKPAGDEMVEQTKHSSAIEDATELTPEEWKLTVFGQSTSANELILTCQFENFSHQSTVSDSVKCSINIEITKNKKQSDM